MYEVCKDKDSDCSLQILFIDRLFSSNILGVEAIRLLFIRNNLHDHSKVILLIVYQTPRFGARDSFLRKLNYYDVQLNRTLRLRFF